MSTLPVALQAHLNSGASTVCILLKITPVQPGVAAFGVTDLDRDVVFDNGDGEMTYHAGIGADLSAWQASNGMSVDNAETKGLVPNEVYNLPVSEDDFKAGAFDYARWQAYLVNYEDLSMGFYRLRRGKFGMVRLVNGQAWFAELLGQTQELKQNVVRQATRSCPATFGSQPIGTEGAVVTEKFPCGKNTSGMWVSGTVTGLAEDLHYVFDTDLAADAGTYRPGAIRWKPGSANAGREYEVESHMDGGVIVLSFPLMFAPEIGDEFEIRADCTKFWDGTNGCKFHFGSEWVLHFRGRRFIPTGEQDRLNTPGASG